VNTSLRRLATICAGLALVAVPFAGATSSATPVSPDQRWVTELKSARQANQAALRQLAQGSISVDRGRDSAEKTKLAKAEIVSAVAHLKKATQVAPEAIGASDDAIATAVSSATTYSAKASQEVRTGSVPAARKDLALAIGAIGGALATFGVPLASDFKAVTSYRELGSVQGWERYMGLTARAPGVAIAKVVIGLLGRETANAGEPGGRRGTPPSPITELAIYTLQEPSGAFSSGWGKLVNGIIVCDLKPTMKANESFAISFAPRVPKGTKFLVKFWSTDGRRSYAILTTK
jgi:hypothetical protein